MRHLSKFGGLEDKKNLVQDALCMDCVWSQIAMLLDPLFLFVVQTTTKTRLGPRQFLFPDALNFGTAISYMYEVHGREPRERIGQIMAIKEFH